MLYLSLILKTFYLKRVIKYLILRKPCRLFFLRKFLYRTKFYLFFSLENLQIREEILLSIIPIENLPEECSKNFNVKKLVFYSCIALFKY